MRKDITFNAADPAGGFADQERWNCGIYCGISRRRSALSHSRNRERPKGKAAQLTVARDL